mmetsp:Transcript_37250/g.54642  ORF Transcript_37250/g.54642 Transcript_37250/m.54642 type:complete len:105 (-) Transcript_37250:1552-1866(-)|eukprot:CAMPEP_0173098914 /NCGR_PEP_ID=MMETSP1102-20130122/35108_1 /TAXON_ID=49646 /ORGANISM="Geminigera sp., Strain Caron Lab Isolate" /LENGTH=104 /DNA_ID=CAMNT_0013991689 /DNA_START=438 /DNA_END=752 /DNA_ORIENTATION=+
MSGGDGLRQCVRNEVRVSDTTKDRKTSGKTVSDQDVGEIWKREEDLHDCMMLVDSTSEGQDKGTVSCVLRDSSGAHHPRSRVIKLGFCQRRKKGEKREALKCAL